LTKEVEEEPVAEQTGDEPARKRHPLVWSLLVIIPILIWSGFPGWQVPQHKIIQRIVPEMADVGKTLSTQLPMQATVATIPIGAFGYYIERPILDLTGLTDVHIAHLEIETGQRNPGHEKFDYEYVFQQEPELIIQLPTLRPYGDEWLDSWMFLTTMNPIQYRIYDFSELKDKYELAWLPVKKKRVVNRKTKKAEVLTVGTYGWLRRDLVNKKGYKKWKVLPVTWQSRIFREIPDKIKNNAMRKIRFSQWNFSGGEQTGLPVAGPEGAGELEQVTPPPAEPEAEAPAPAEAEPAAEAPAPAEPPAAEAEPEPAADPAADQ
ncbi:MAG: hypothetical protein ACTSXZ_00095, partial [Alphaproteobacteria bacterium]